MKQHAKRPDKQQSNFDFKGIVLKPVIPVLLAVLVAVTLLTDVMDDSLSNGWQEMTDLISVEIRSVSYGTVEAHGNTFPVVNKGDSLIVNIPLPEDRMLENAMLGFNIPHVAGYACYGDEILWSYGQDLLEEGKYVGNLFFRVPLRDEMWGGSVQLVLNVTENHAFSSINNVQAMPAHSSIRYFFSQFQMDIFLFLSFFVLFSIAFFVFLFYGRMGDLRFEGLFLSAFCSFMGLWFLAGHGFFYAFSDIIPICAHLEYIAFHLMPIPFCLFMIIQVKNTPGYRIFCEVMSVLFTVLFIVATILNYTTADYHYTTFLPILQVGMLIGVAGSVWMLVRRQHAENLSSKVIRYGVAISMLLLMLEVARYNICKYVDVASSLSDLSFVSTGMLVFAGALTVGYIARLTDAVGEESDRTILQRLAYMDILTGIPNLTHCIQKIEEMEKRGEKNFALVFFDLNSLKWANDQFGHDMGDKFLQTIAKTIQSIFGQQQFYGRWGGDEFIACLTGSNVRHADKMLRDFDRKIQQINDSGEFPFYVSAAYGMVQSSGKNTITITEAINEADRRMYSSKLRMHVSRDTAPTETK